MNPNFDPIDLFIRLNDKPYPIRQNSFEMWNSWVTQKIIIPIRKNVRENISWFYVRKIRGWVTDRDRMVNEEMYTSLAYLEFLEDRDRNTALDIYQKGDRINARIADKSSITLVLENSSQDDSTCDLFIQAIDKVSNFIFFLKLLLSPNGNEEECNMELELLLKSNATTYFRRSFQDFYILWYILNGISELQIRKSSGDIKNEMRTIFRYMKEADFQFESEKSYDEFELLVSRFREKYIDFSIK